MLSGIFKKKVTHSATHRWKMQTGANQKNLLESFENLPHHLPHLGYQLEDPERTQAAQHHQQLSPRLRRNVRR